MQTPQTPFYKRSAFIYLCIACVALIVTGIAAMFHNNQPGSKFKNFSDQLVTYDIPPGGNKAILTLEDGRTITLNEVPNGKLADQSGVTITKIGHGELAYHTETTGALVHAGITNTIVTPNGGTYVITLADGTRVWLNAESKLSFPATFDGMQERKVDLVGEAYFEVVSERKPFKVLTKNQEIEVSATHFNVECYPGDVLSKTTLFEGPAKVGTTSAQKVSLVPGQQAIINQGTIRLITVDLDDVLAWKSGVFVFEEEPLEDIMKKISRWYDVDVIYQNIDKNKLFTANAPRSENVSKVLKRLELSGGVHFKIEEGRIIVTGL